LVGGIIIQVTKDEKGVNIHLTNDEVVRLYGNELIPYRKLAEGGAITLSEFGSVDRHILCDLALKLKNLYQP
jgi:hypothetical protein